MDNTEGLIKVFVNGKLPKDKYSSANELLEDIADVLAIDEAKLVVELINLPDIKGEKGDKGDRGEVGPQGPDGGPGAAGPAGPTGTGLRYLGDWDVLSISYSISDVVLHGGIYYVCKDAHVSGAITEPGVGASWTDVWDVLDATFIGQDGISFIWQSQWLTATTYNANDVVYNNGSSYICILGHLSSATDEPGVGVNTATYWDLMTGATGLSNEVFATLADAAPVVWAASATAAHQNAKVTITATRVLSLTGWTSGMHGTLQVIQDGVGGWGVTLPAGSKVEGGGAGAVTLTAAAGSIDVLDVFYDGTNYFWSLKPNYT